MTLFEEIADLPEWLRPRLADLLKTQITANELQIRAIPGGGNNRVFRIDANSVTYLVKWYFSAPEDPRDRLQNEWKFANFAWQHGVRCLARPIASDFESRLAVFEFMTGRKLGSAELNIEHIRAATGFLSALNRHRESSGAWELPAASEACFSIGAHIHCIEQRVTRLEKVCEAGSASGAVADFIRDKLKPAADRVVQAIRTETKDRPHVEHTELTKSEQIISPSDFGFHNALLDDQGHIRFFDFEYAGWDDPAKTACDFFAQVQVPVPAEFWSLFLNDLLPITGTEVAWRAELLRPLYLVKWCCIVLNPLFKVGRERRQFSTGQDVGWESCLEKAERVLAAVE